MIRKMGYDWHLRQLMATHGMFQTSDLLPLLEERGIHLSREQVYRLVTSPPQRLNMEVLDALCLILGCTPNDLITFEDVTVKQTRVVGGTVTELGALRTVPAKLVRPDKQ